MKVGKCKNWQPESHVTALLGGWAVNERMQGLSTGLEDQSVCFRHRLVGCLYILLLLISSSSKQCMDRWVLPPCTPSATSELCSCWRRPSLLYCPTSALLKADSVEQDSSTVVICTRRLYASNWWHLWKQCLLLGKRLELKSLWIGCSVVLLNSTVLFSHIAG